MSAQGRRKVGGVAFEKAVRRKPLARRMRELCKLNGVRERCRGPEEGSAGVCEGELPLDAILLDEVKKVSRGNGDTLRRDAVKRADSAVCG
jgi:hypothetical protein